MAKIIDGKATAATIRTELAIEVAVMQVEPTLAVIIVGDDPASHVYVRYKEKAAAECGINSTTDKLPADTSEAELLARLDALNKNKDVHGILVQLPLPDHIDTNKIVNGIAPEKDVDGFHVVNAGRLATGQDSLVPCTPQGCLILLKSVYSHSPLGGESKRTSEAQADSVRGQDSASQYHPPHPNPLPQGERELGGLHAVVIGKSNIVGRPMAQLLMNEGCTVTVCHSRTKDTAAQCKRADIVVSAVGILHLVKGDWIKKGATVIDVGMNRKEDGTLSGDVDFEAAKQVAGAITPVPGGVGPMTIACLLKNTVKAAKAS